MSYDDLTPKQKELADLMSDISEDWWCAGWMQNLEYSLWELVCTRKTELGRHMLYGSQLNDLIRLSGEIGGWIYFDLDGLQAETFVPMDDWLEMYNKEVSE